MAAAIQAPEVAGYPDEARRVEYSSLPEQPDYENHVFEVVLTRSGRVLEVPEDQTISELLLAHGVAVDVKCADGLCGVCECGSVSGAVEHRERVLSKAQREGQTIPCQSLAAPGEGRLVLDL